MYNTDMQPHTQVALKVAQAAWDSEKYQNVKSGLISVEYTNRYGLYETKYYNFEVYKLTPTELKVAVSHSHGSSRCTVSVLRNSDKEGAKVTIEHSEHHAHGFAEELSLYKKNFKGDHRNSLLYRNFGADFSYPEKMVLHTDVKSGNSDAFRDIKYDVEIKSFVEDKKSSNK